MTQLPQTANGRTAREVALQAVMEAGALLRERFLGDVQVAPKGRGSIVTNVDLLAEEHILGLLQGEFPSVGILAEESAPVASASGYTWVIDPLDGTRNYAAGIPVFSVVVALAQGDEVILGLTYDPLREELFLAERGKGATLNGVAIHVSPRTTLKEGVLGFDMGYEDKRAQEALKLMVDLWPGMRSIRVLGSAALGLAYAASGRLDLYLHQHLSPWDIAAGLLLVREAGGVATDKDGAPAIPFSESVVASSPTLHAEFMGRSEASEWRGVVG